MDQHVTWFEPQPDPAEHPAAFPDPFGEAEPQSLARQAANDLQARLRHGVCAPGAPTSLLDTEAGGKMFGVLVVADRHGRVGWLRAFSGQLDGRWEVTGYVPPLFDQIAFNDLQLSGEPRVKELTRLGEAFATSPALLEARWEAEALAQRQAEEWRSLRDRHRIRRQRRQEQRTVLSSPDARHALDQESRGDKAERRRLEAAHEAEREAAVRLVDRLERRLAALDRLRQRTSRDLMRRMHDTYAIHNARGETRSLRDLFAPGEPPSGAGDCAAPKLIGYALAHNLRPIALAEFWWGRPPPSGGRFSGAFYPACREKCGPVLPFMLQGLPMMAPQAFSVRARTRGDVKVIHEDEHLVVVDKPEGLLSVPGKEEGAANVLELLRARYPETTGPLLVHRLDLDTSGLLIAALNPAAHAELQRQFAHREVMKRYIAWLEGEPAGSEGEIDLPLRVDVNDRPRQIVDAQHGKPAVTRWRVVEQRDGRSRVALSPLTGRTHQLRVHVAHPLGLAAPIVGDRLYGRPGGRLMLHAEAISLRHPATGALISFESPAPF